MSEKLTTARHLQRTAQCAQSLVAQVAGAFDADMTALENAKQDKIKGTPGQVAGFNAAGELTPQSMEGQSSASLVSFTSSQWSGGVLTIPQSSHGRTGAAFGYTLRQQINGALRESTWAVKCTEAVYVESSGAITLKSPDAYDGQIVFFG